MNPVAPWAEQQLPPWRSCTGPRADDPRYLPAIARVREGLGQRGLLDVGDCKMGALETRAVGQAGGDYYLCPLSELPVPPTVLATYLAPVWTGAQPLTPSHRGPANGRQELLAEGVERLAPLTTAVADEPIRWTARRLVIRSHQLAQAGARALRARLATAHATSTALNARRRGKRRVSQLPARPEAVAALVASYHAQGVLSLRDEAPRRPWSGRRDGDRPAMVRVEQDWHGTASVDPEAVEVAVRPWGWRVDATNQPADPRSRGLAVLA
jgi:hypothetical protein